VEVLLLSLAVPLLRLRRLYLWVLIVVGCVG
jgi:hypothetical protein